MASASVGRNIVLLADGTGNSSGKLFRTNVWRLYQAVDQAPPSGATAGQPQQIAYYHDGVGTSSFKPLAILGGAFGWGLKRNVLDLYSFLCRAYRPGDRIYAFGFSRGAFTIRVLIGLIVDQGLLRDPSEADLPHLVRDAYRAFRRAGFHRPAGSANPILWLRDQLRSARYYLVRAWRKLWKQAIYDPQINYKAGADFAVNFVGVWDTVAAYGLPFDELTHGIDKWVWPLSMPDYKLSERVLCARHALALDDERNTFHPLLWDEVHEATLIAQYEADAKDGLPPEKRRGVPSSRLEQVWFAGVHSDIGGGYPDDGQSYVTLQWMIDEAAKAGLRCEPTALAEVARAANPLAPLHNSRRGLAGYYRYQPRKIGAWALDPAAAHKRLDDTTFIMRDPRLDEGLLTAVKLHPSVLTRIAHAPSRYSPIVVPRRYTLYGANGVTDRGPLAAAEQEAVWNLVWKRRIGYFATLAASFGLAVMPLYHHWHPPAACTGPQCALTPFIESAAALLPGIAGPWSDAFARTPGTFAALVAALVVLLLWSAALQRRIVDAIHAVWQNPPQRVRKYRLDSAIIGLRRNWLYQHGLRWLKWKLLPTAAGLGTLVLAAIAVVIPPYFTYERALIALDDPLCGNQSSGVAQPVGTNYAPARTANGAPVPFPTNDACWPMGRTVKAGERYRIMLTVTAPWLDETIPASPLGFASDQFRGITGYVALFLRRSITGRWFQPYIAVLDGDRTHAYPLEFQAIDLPETYVADFEAPRDGEVFLFVNDVVVRPTALANVLLDGYLDKAGLRSFYTNNYGAADVSIRWLKKEPR